MKKRKINSMIPKLPAEYDSKIVKFVFLSDLRPLGQDHRLDYNTYVKISRGHRRAVAHFSPAAGIPYHLLLVFFFGQRTEVVKETKISILSPYKIEREKKKRNGVGQRCQKFVNENYSRCNILNVMQSTVRIITYNLYKYGWSL